MDTSPSRSMPGLSQHPTEPLYTSTPLPQNPPTEDQYTPSGARLSHQSYSPHPGVEDMPIAGPSTTPVPAVSSKKSVKKTPRAQPSDQLAATLAFVPGVYNVKNPAGYFGTKEHNNEVARQISLARAKRMKEDEEEERKRKEELAEPVEVANPLNNILIIHPGSRNLRFGRASDFYPKEVPNCIARPKTAPHRGRDPPIPGSRAKQSAVQTAEARAGQQDQDTGNWGMDAEQEEVQDPVDTNIHHLRTYLKNRLIQNKLATDWRDATRVVAANSKVRPEGIPEHNDPYRIDWTEEEERQVFVGTDAIRLAPNSKFAVRWPILNRRLNTRDWKSRQMLIDDIAFILQESLRSELGLAPRDYSNFSVVLIVPDHGDRVYVQEMTNLLLSEMSFKAIAVHQEAYAATFSAGMSTACVVDMGAQITSVTCVDEGVVAADSRINLAYGGDDITTALSTILSRSAFPYRDLNLAKSQEWIMMDKLKMKICTLEEHLVANVPWDFYVLRTEGLTQKYIFRTYDENILAPLSLFDTRMIDFEEKKGEGEYQHHTSEQDFDDTLLSAYGDISLAMKACTTHLSPAPPPPPAESTPAPATENGGSVVPENGLETPNGSVPPEIKPEDTKPTETPSRAATPSVHGASSANGLQSITAGPPVDDADIIEESSRVPLDAAIAASISAVGTENKIKSASGAILLIGGSSALKGLNAFLAERIPPLLRARNLPIQEVHIVPPPRGLNPRFVSWKGASVMCNLESLSDMWIRRDEWEAVGARALKERYLFF